MNKLQRILISIAVVLVILFFFVRLVVLILMQNAPELGVEQGRLKDCPDYPACVSSQAEPTDETHYVESIANMMPVDNAKGTVQIIMQTITGATLVAEEDRYLHYEIKVAPFGFVDDVEFYFPRDKAPIEVRSSARVPYYDFEVNRERVEIIRKRFTTY